MKLVALGIFISALLSFAIPASGITFGREVTNGSISYPSVVSIWTSEDAESDAYLMCSGTLITNRIVLTAAHCVNSTDLYYVQYGADQLYDDTDLLEVAATWKNPRFSERQLVNDTGLLLLKEPIPGAVTTRLPSVSEIKSMQANKNVKYEIVGWGKDQNGESASYLRKAPVDDQTNFMKKAKWWRNDVWFAVGKWNKSEKVFAGSCNGDSGGPLFATVGSKTILAGITSWGAEDCETAQPSIYVRLSYYINEINKVGIPTLLVNETKQNRALPSVVVEPRIIGTPRTGSVLSCDTGQWSSNTTNVTYSWSGSGVPYGFTGSTVAVTANNSFSAKDYVCTVRARNSNGTIERRLSVTQNPPPSNISRPTISNMPTVAFNGNVSISCNPGTFNFSNSVSNEWWVGESSYFEPNTRIGTGNTLVFGASSFTAWGGKYLYCKSVASGDGGTTATMSSSSLIPAFQKPIIKTYPNISGLTSWQSPAIGTVATCSGWSWSNVMTTESVGWYINSSDALSGATLLQNGATITLTQSFLEAYKSRYLICAVTGVNQGGTQIMYDTHYLYYFPSAAPTPVAPTPVAPTPTPIPTVSSVKPNTPGNLRGIIGATSVELSWLPAVDNGRPVTDYLIERSTSTSDWIVLNDGVSTRLSYTDTGLTPGTRYDYRIRAFNGVLYSDYSWTISAGIPLASTTAPTVSSLTCVLIKNGAVDQTSKKPCTELSAAGINTTNLALNQTISRSDNTFTTNQLFSPVPGDNYFVTWWISDTAYDKNNWTYTVMGSQVKILQEVHGGVSFTPSQAVLESLKGKYLIVQAIYGYSRFNILQANGLSVLAPTGIGSILIP